MAANLDPLRISLLANTLAVIAFYFGRSLLSAVLCVSSIFASGPPPLEISIKKLQHHTVEK